MADFGGLSGRDVAAGFARAFPDAALLVFSRELRIIWALGAVPTRDQSSPVAGLPSSQVLAPEHWRRCEPLFRAALSGSPGSIEVARLDGQGSLLVAVEPLHEVGGAVVGGLCVWREITATRRLEEELAQRGRLLDLAHDAIIVRDPIRSAVTYWNHEAEQIYGHSAALARGQVTHELLATVFPVSKDEVEDALFTQGHWDGELRHRRADGQWILVSSRQALVRNEAGEPTAVIELNSDITEQSRAQRELRAAEQRFRSLIDSAPDAMVIVDEDATIVLVNTRTEKLFGYSRTELIGKPVEMLLPGGLRLRHTRHRGEYMAEPHARSMGVGLDLLARRQDGTEFAADISLSPLQTESGLLISASVRDASQQLLRQLEQSLVPRLRIGARWDVAWRYRPAVRTMLLAGDFIGAAERTDGSLAMLIGDVTGHGAAAAGTGATLRAAWLGATQSDLAMASIPGLLHRLLVNQADRGAVPMATACLAEIDPDGTELRLIRAGHDCPLLITPEGATRLDAAHGPALGLPGPAHWPLERLPLPADSGIMLYTDGLTERRRAPGSIRYFDELAPRIDARTMLDRPPGQALDHLLATTFPAGSGELEDDVAVLLVNLRRTVSAEDDERNYIASNG